MISALLGLVRSAVLNLKVLNDGLARHEATLIVPTMYVLHTVLTITGGELLYQTYRDLEWMEGLCFSVAVVVSILGVYILAQSPPDDEEENWQEMGSQDDYATLETSVDGASEDLVSEVPPSSRAEKTPPRLEPRDDGQLWLEPDDAADTATNQRWLDDEYEDAELAHVIEKSLPDDGAAITRLRAGSAPRLTTNSSHRTASPEHDEVWIDENQVGVQVGIGDEGVGNRGAVNNDSSPHAWRGRHQRSHRRGRSISSSPPRPSRLRGSPGQSRQSVQGHSPGRDLRYVLVTSSSPDNTQHGAPLSALSRARPSPGAVDLSLWRASIVPARTPRASPLSVPAGREVRSLADSSLSPSSAAVAAAANHQARDVTPDEVRTEGRRLFDTGQSSDDVSDETAET